MDQNKLAAVDQNKVVSTVRGSEVAADPTNALALEAAFRRRRARGGAALNLAAIQRVLRGQRFDGPAQAHFTLLGLVTAGRDTGNREFERRHLASHLTVLMGVARAAGHREVRVRLTSLGLDTVAAQVAEDVRTRSDAEVVADPERRSGRGYYTGVCLKVDVGRPRRPGEWFEVADGGFVDWTRRLLGDRKERLLISGAGLDRIVLPPDPAV